MYNVSIFWAGIPIMADSTLLYNQGHRITQKSKGIQIGTWQKYSNLCKNRVESPVCIIIDVDIHFFAEGSSVKILRFNFRGWPFQNRERAFWLWDYLRI